MKDLLRIKKLKDILSDSEKEEHKLKRALGWFDLTMMGIGGIIGAGIFTAIGTAIAGNADRPGAGPAIVVSMLMCAVACVFSALCYAEFAAMIPIAGSAYTYAYATLGETIAWIIGWDLIIEYAVGNIAVAISWGAYFKQLMAGLGVHIPGWISTDLRTGLHTPDIVAQAPHLFGIPLIVNLPAVAITAVITWILIIGIKESARANNLMVIIKLLIMGLFLVVGFRYVQPANWHPFWATGWAGVQAGAAIIFFSYIGFDAITTAAEETRNPKRDLPVGLFASLAVSTLIYIGIALALTGIVPWQSLGVADPLAHALALIHQDWAAGVLSFGAVVAMAAVLLVFQLGQPRIFFSMSRDGLLPRIFSRVHPVYRTPHVTTLWTGIFVMFFSAFASIDEVVELTNIGTLFAFVLVCGGVMILRHTNPHHPRPFRTPWVPLLPLWLGVLWLLPRYVVRATDGGSRLEYLLLIAIATLGTVFSLVGVGALIRGRRVPEVVKTEFALAGIAACFWLMRGLPIITWWRFGLWLVAGLDIYLLYGLHRSKLASGPRRWDLSFRSLATLAAAAAAIAAYGHILHGRVGASPEQIAFGGHLFWTAGVTAVLQVLLALIAGSRMRASAA
jgi:APA family basic amino acid/polyamine antiporter